MAIRFRMPWRRGAQGLVMLVALCAINQSREATASCGSATCFLVIGSQAGASQKGALTANLIYNYIPQGTLLEGTTGIIPGLDTDTRMMTLNEHREIRTINQFYTLDLNYGVTDDFGIELTIPYRIISHRHIAELGTLDTDGQGTPELFTDNGLGDIRVTAKYNVLTSLRNLFVFGFGVDLPTGKNNSQSNIPGHTQEPTLQLGRGQVGLAGSVYQSYELLPHRLNEFASFSYRHTFKNNNGYQYGDEYLLSAGLNLRTWEWLILTAQFNYRYLVHDTFSSSLFQAQDPSDPGDPIPIDPLIRDRAVPTTGSTTLMFTPGFSVEVAPATSVYFYSQIPVARDFNNNLAQGVSYIVGVSHVFNLKGL
jgi:hypothetical protein